MPEIKEKTKKSNLKSYQTKPENIIWIDFLNKSEKLAASIDYETVRRANRAKTLKAKKKV